MVERVQRLSLYLSVVQAISAAPALHVSDGSQWWLMNWLAPAGEVDHAN